MREDSLATAQEVGSGSLQFVDDIYVPLHGGFGGHLLQVGPGLVLSPAREIHHAWTLSGYVALGGLLIVRVACSKRALMLSLIGVGSGALLYQSPVSAAPPVGIARRLHDGDVGEMRREL